MRLPDSVARFNRHVTNPIALLGAGKLPGFGIIEHVGRRSGRVYRTPVNVFSAPGGLAFVLTYGPNRDWVRNLRAENGGVVEHNGYRVRFVDPAVVPAAEARSFLSPFARRLVAVAGFDYVMRVTLVDAG